MHTRLIPYIDHNKTFEGFLAYNGSSNDKRPGIILCHAWGGRDDFICEKAKEIAQWGYVTFALDLYGQRILGKSKEENTALMMPFLQDRSLLQRRLQLALKTFQEQPYVDSQRIATLGFCFGGLCALDFARGGADLKGAISMHGLFNPAPELKNQSIKAKILALHGREDPLVPPDMVASFEQEMTAAGADWQLHIFGHTMHAFTNPQANDPDFGTVYNPVSAKRAWQAARNFLAECFS